MEAEKEEHELKVIKEKYGNELLQQVRKDMGLPKDPVPKIVPALIGNPHASEHDTPSPSLEPSALLSKVKMEKYSISELAEPDISSPSSHVTSPRGQKRQHQGVSTPPPKQYANKDDLFTILTPKSKAKSSHQALFSPQGKVAPAPELYDNSLDVRSSE